MKLSADKIVQYVAVLGCAAALIGSYHFSRVSVTAAASKTPLSTDQMIASLSTNVTVLGGIVAIATVAIGVAALYGYGELRAATFRKTEEDMIKVIVSLQKTGQLTAVQANAILQGIAPDRFLTGLGASPQPPNRGEPASQDRAGDIKSDDKIARDYPEGT